MKLKRARLADDLNEKIAHRPGPMELVEKNILPVDTSVKKAVTGKYPCNKTAIYLEIYINVYIYTQISLPCLCGLAQ